MRKFNLVGQYPPLLMAFPTVEKQSYFVSPKKVDVFEFYTVSDGSRRIFTEGDSLKGYGEQRIIGAERVSYTNLFINGVLQPQRCYEIEEGKIMIKTDDIPLRGTPIILQMIKL
ncbi:DUF4183 domain-containing protein [Bacillus sp. DJP31]|uniref:DUF4183 domain-containing protein n=1 Tax=Bacillus sp. DJP31 TaxID=3409789 RepID=UPI003BB6A3CD